MIEGEITPELKKAVIDATKPLDAAQIAKELAIVEVLTKRRDDGDFDTKLLISVYVDKLRKYPADVVKYVLGKAPENSAFFPAWFDLYEDLEFWSNDRFRLRDAILTPPE